jgi:uncharacterized protein (TIGR02246 family)
MNQPPLDAAEISGALQTHWAAAFGQRDWKLLAALYTDDAQLFGGKPELFTSREGVRRYFEAMPPVGLVAEFGSQHVVQAGHDAIVSAGDVTFRRTVPAAEPRPHRITMVLVRRDGQWRIASHHASPKDGARRE